MRFHLVQTDEDIAGDYNDGFQMAVESVAKMIGTPVQPEDGPINLIGSSFFDIPSRRGLSPWRACCRCSD